MEENKKICRHALNVNDSIKTCAIFGSKAKTPCYIDGRYYGEICNVYNEDICKDKEVDDVLYE